LTLRRPRRILNFDNVLSAAQECQTSN